jgi:hypothetical protein
LVPTLRCAADATHVQAPHWPYYTDDQLEPIRRELNGRGVCVIRAVRCPTTRTLKAIEGSHRLYLAALEGIEVFVQEVGLDYRLQADNPAEGIVTAASIISPAKERWRGHRALYRVVAP